MSLQFNPFTGLQNGVSMNVEFVKHMYESVTAGTANFTLDGITGNDVFYARAHAKFPNLYLDSVAISSNIIGIKPDGAVTGLYGCYFSDFYKSTYFATSASLTLVPPSAYADQIRYFTWSSILYDSCEHAISGLMAFSHTAETNFLDTSVTALIDWNNDYVTITACVWNVDDKATEMCKYNMTVSDSILFIRNETTGAISAEEMFHAIESPVGNFNRYNYFWHTFPMSDLSEGTTYKYWLKLNDNWNAKTSYSSTGMFKVTDKFGVGGSYDISCTAVTGDTTGSTRGDSLTSWHSSIAVSVDKDGATGGNNWYWKDIFQRSWTA